MSKVPGQGMNRGFIFVVIFIASLAFSEVAISEEASIEGLTIELNGQMEVSFFVANCCTEKLEEEIQSGVPTTFTFRVKLYLVRGLWPTKRWSPTNLSTVLSMTI